MADKTLARDAALLETRDHRYPRQVLWAGPPVDWISQFRGQFVYDAAAAAVVRSAARNNPAGAATLFETLSEARRAEVAKRFGASWGSQDMPAARNWVATLPSGSMRDSALSGVIEAFDDGAPDARILSLFSSDLILQEAIR